MEPLNSSIDISGGHRDEEFSQDNDDGQWSRHVETDADSAIMHAPSPLSEIPLPNQTGSATDFDVDGDDDDYDDEDTWSRKVETDEIQRLPSSVTGDAATVDDDDDIVTHLHHGDAVNGGGAGAPQREEPTLKEKLVERERQRRVESERARWRRQFAMAAHTETDDEDHHLGTLEGNMAIGRSDEEDGMAIRETNSVAGTVGEDTVAPIETLEEENPIRLNYPMERFLQDQGNIMAEDIAANNRKEGSREANQNQGVVMERFLQETPVVIVDHVSTIGDVAMSSNNVHRSVSFETDPPVSNNRTFPGEEARAAGAVTSVSSLEHDFLNMSTAFSSLEDTSNDRLAVPQDQLERPQSQDNLPFGLVTSTTASIANASTICLPPAEDEQETNHLHLEANPNETTASRSDQLCGPEEGETIVASTGAQSRVILRLTEAEIQEMAAIDEASRSNAPPSERDDMSELGELVGDFGAPVHHETNMSQGTPTTAMESASSVANQSSVVIMNMSSSYHAEDQHSVDAMGTGSMSSHVGASSAEGDGSVAANPSIDSGRDDEAPRSPIANEVLPLPSSVGGMKSSRMSPDISLPILTATPSSEQHFGTFALAVLPGVETEVGLQGSGDENIVNRTMRPGMFNFKQTQSDAMKNLERKPSSPLKKASSFPDHIVNSTSRMEHVDGFDFDKNQPLSPRSPPGMDGYDDFTSRNELWSPGLSPLRSVQLEGNSDPSLLPSLPNYGTTFGQRTDHDVETQRCGSGRKTDERNEVGDKECDPLIAGGIPKEVAAVLHHRRASIHSLASIRGMDDVHSIAESVFSDIRSESTATKNSISNEAQEYLESSILMRAFPERLFALGVTLIFEIPVLLMVSGGSDRLCYLIGRTKYQLLIGFLPLSSAISGNVGLQSSTLTTRAISHGHVKVENYTSWLFKEIGAAFYLGFGMGGLLGAIAYVASGYSFAFALTVMIAQFISIVTAGCTGTFAPLIFTFIFHRDSGKWGGPLETAVQDIVGSFAMVVISYRILVWFGPFEIDSNDTCGTGD